MAINFTEFVAQAKLKSVVKVREHREGTDADRDLANQQKKRTVDSRSGDNKAGRNPCVGNI